MKRDHQDHGATTGRGRAPKLWWYLPGLIPVIAGIIVGQKSSFAPALAVVVVTGVVVGVGFGLFLRKIE